MVSPNEAFDDYDGNAADISEYSDPQHQNGTRRNAADILGGAIKHRRGDTILRYV